MKNNGFSQIIFLICFSTLLVAVIAYNFNFLQKANSVFLTNNQDNKGSNFLSNSSTVISTPTQVPTLVPTSPTNNPQKTHKIHIYNYPIVGIEKIKILGIYFAAKGDENLMPSWREDMQDVLSQVINFYTRELEGNSSIRFVTVRVIGEKAYNDYKSNSEIINEIRSRILESSGDLYDSQVAEITPDEYRSLMIFIDYTLPEIEKGPVNSFGAGLDFRGGALKPPEGLGTMGAFWLNKEARTKNNYGVVGTAHEFGHTLNIAHPWEDKNLNPSGDKNYGNVGGNIMGYSFNGGLGDRGENRPLMEGYLMPEQKRKLGLN